MALENDRKHDAWGSRDRKKVAANVLVLVAAALILMVGLNVLARKMLTRFPWMRTDLTEVQLHALSPTTKALLDGQDPDAKVYVILKSVARTRGQRRVESLAFRRILDLVAEYKLYAPGLRVETIDVDRDPKMAQQISERLELRQLKPQDVTRVAMISGDRRRDVKLNEMVTLNWGTEQAPPSIVSFHAEAALTSALVQVLNANPPQVYFLLGHGEGDPASDHAQNGFSKARELIERIGLEVKVLDLDARREVPRDAAALVIAGLRSDLPEPEARALQEYFKNGGRGLFLIPPMVDVPNLGEVLAPFNLELMEPDLIALDKTQSQFGKDWSELAILQGITAYHPITEPLYMSGVRVYLGATRPLVKVMNDTTVTPVPLLKCTSRERSESFAFRLSPDRLPRGRWSDLSFDPEIDVHTPLELDLAYAVEAPGTGGTARLVVVGSSNFLSNARVADARAAEGANQEFLVNTINWLVDRKIVVGGITPRADLDRTLAMTEDNDRLFLIFFVGALPGLAGLLGLVTWMVRRK